MGKQIPELTELNEAPASGDYFILRDTSAVTDKKISFANLMKNEVSSSDFATYQESVAQDISDINETIEGTTVRTTAQTFTDAQKAQARANIDALEADGTYDALTSGTAKSVLGDNYTEDSVPYIYRASASGKSDRLSEEIVGGTIAWNQLIPTTVASSTANGITYTNNGDGSWTITGQRTNTNNFKNITTTTTTVQILHNEHVYFIGGATSNVGIALASNGTPTVPINTSTTTVKKLSYTEGTGSWIRFQILSADEINETIIPQVFDLTQMFGSTIADYIYSLEQATAGAGVAWFRNLFPEDYYEYNSGELKSVEGLNSHDTVGKNLLPVTGASIYTTNGITFARNADGTVTAKGTATAHATFAFRIDTNHLYGNLYFNGAVGGSSTTYDCFIWDVTVNARCRKWNGTTAISSAYQKFEEVQIIKGHYVTFQVRVFSGTTVNYTIFSPMICLPTVTDTTYEPYSKHTYPLDSSLTLRGIPKLDSNNNLYYDGDTYEPDGTVTRKYGIRAYQSGDATDDLTMITDGTNTVYQLSTPTAETAEPFAEYQICGEYGTEEYVTTGIVPVGHNTKYYENVKEKVAGLPWDFSTLIAPTEYGTASQNYAVGSYLIMDNILYKVTSAITSGATITPNTNVTATTIMAELMAL